MHRSPDFFLSTAGEYGPLAEPRAAWRKMRLRDEIRDDHMLVEIDPVLDGQRFGLDADINSLIISARHSGQTMFPISEWPSFVYVSRVLDDSVFSSHIITRETVEIIAWGMLFRTRGEAASHAEQYKR